MKYFKLSIIVTILGLILVAIWGHYFNPDGILKCLFITILLSILEISLSFDNAVVNAVKLQTMTHKWQQRFLTWGILIAVFGVRFVFPILIVAIFSGLSVITVTDLVFNDPDKYTYYLHQSHAAISAFGGMFLFMVFLNFMIDKEKDMHWINIVEIQLSKLARLKYLPTLIALVSIIILHYILPETEKDSVTIAGISGLILYILINALSNWLEKVDNSDESVNLEEVVKQGGLISFLYLELLDASFSLDGVVGAFAISNDIVIIAIGLCIGAMFVRSLTIYFVEKKTLLKYVYLKHGAHWAIGALAIIMLYQTIAEVSEIITGLIGVAFIGMSFFSSLKNRNKGQL
ncbi:MAG: DUF475 domain-containing protein [Cyanobacteriota bacterium]